MTFLQAFFYFYLAYLVCNAILILFVFQVNVILNSSVEGKQIIAIGQKTGALPSNVRGRLCKLLMEKLITAENPVLLTDSQLLALSYDIGRLFKEESPPLYYAPYLPADAYQAKRNISGWLVTARRARRQHLVSLGLIEKPKSRSRSKSSLRLDSPSLAGIDLTGLKEGNSFSRNFVFRLN